MKKKKGAICVTSCELKREAWSLLVQIQNVTKSNFFSFFSSWKENGSSLRNSQSFVSLMLNIFFRCWNPVLNVETYRFCCSSLKSIINLASPVAEYKSNLKSNLYRPLTGAVNIPVSEL